MPKLIIIDGNALVHRAFHALPPLTSPKGIVTNAVFGFTSILLKMVRELKPEYIVATFDLAGPTIRHEEFADYKIHRKKAPQELYDQIPLVKDVLRAFGIPIYEKQGYEADDVLGTIATKAKKKKGLEVIIATGDLDTLQLVDKEKVQVLTLRKGVSDTILYNEATVKERYGLEPSQLVDFRGLKGDPSDNIPGVSGIGEKTASTLIREFATLENLYKQLEKDSLPKGVTEKLKEKLLEQKDQAFLSKELSKIYIDLEIDFTLQASDWQKKINRQELETIFRDLGFASLARRLNELPNISQNQTLFEQALPDTVTIQNKQIKSIDDLDKIIVSAQTSGQIAIQALFDEHYNLVKVVLAYDNKTNFHYILSDFKQQLVEPLQKLLGNKKINKIGHDIKPFVKYCFTNNIVIQPIMFDSIIGAYLLNPDSKQYDFETIYYKFFGKALEGMPDATPAHLIELLPKLSDALHEMHQDNIFNTIEIPLIETLANMELRGIKVNAEMLKILLDKSDKEIKILEKKIYSMAGQEFNINSPAQLGVILYDVLKIKGKIKKTTGGARSTAAGELEKILDEHPIIEFILQYRELQKLKTTYIEPFPSLIGNDGRIHTTYSQISAATGRLASQDPNLQNIPTRTELGQEFRKAFVAKNGYELVACDYSQLELRIAAHLAHDEKMIETFRRGEDIHTRTAAEIFGVTPDKVTKEMRRQAKVLNFGLIYGMGPVAFSRTAKVSMAEAKGFIERYFSEFSGIARFMEDIKHSARQLGYTETLFGRRRSAIDMASSMPQLRAQAERIAINHPVQGTEADLIKMAMIAIDHYLKKEDLEDDVRMLLQVHDELVFEIKQDLIKKIVPKLGELMTSVANLDVPLTVDIKAGNNWAEMKKI